MQMPIVYTQEELHARRSALPGRVALVPTMGALHEGHLALVREARKRADAVIVYIFVNPRQFGPNEDYDRYPRRLEADAALLAGEGVAFVYAPGVEDVYPAGYDTTVSVGRIGQVFEGTHRPGFFDGVATVLAKMFIRIRPDVAVFGEKDYQQLAVVRQLARDLDLGIQIIGLPTQREADGLALSSRNAYLSEGERAAAPALHAALREAADGLKKGVPVPDALAKARARLADAGFARVDYVCLVHAASFAELEAYAAPARLLAAAWLGKTRLIDNIGVES